MYQKEAYYHKKLEALKDPDRIFDRPPLPTDSKAFHIIGICGKAMGTLAGLLQEKGYTVSGSDEECHPPISTMLERLDISVQTEFDSKKLEHADVVIVGNVAGPMHPEAAHAREQNKPQAALPEILREYVFGDAKRIVIGGTHGKTTTTGLVARIFEVAGKDPGYLIGGVPQDGDTSFNLGAGEYAIFEGDEYDTSYFNKMPKFLQYGAHTGIVTSMELDHLDIYKDFEDYKQAFQFFAQDIPKDGFLFLCGDDQEIQSLKEETQATVYMYGLDDTNDLYAKDIVQHDDGTQTFTLVFQEEEKGKVKTLLSGKHNVANIVGAIGIALVHGISFETIAEGIAQFKGMKKRQEVVGEIDGVMVIDDFAHHPTAVATTLDGLKKKYKDRRMIALFEPRSNTSRKKIFEEEYTKSFDAADIVYLKTPPFRHNDVEDDFMDPDVVAVSLREQGKEVFVFERPDQIFDALIPTLQKDDVVVGMSNGDFDGIHQKILDKLSSLK